MAAYYGIIPATVRYDKDIPANAKLLFSEFTALCQENGYCWSRNAYFAELYGVSKETVSRWISLLNSKNYIRIQYTYKYGSNEIDERRIYINDIPAYDNENKQVKTSTPLIISSIPPCENNQPPLDENIKDNNTSYNNTSLKKEIYKESDKSQPNEQFDTNVRTVSITEAVKQIYNAYPRKLGKAKGVEYALAYLGKGRKITGFGNIKFNHEELYCAVRHYAIDCENKGTEPDFLKHFSTFMNKDVIDYVDLAKEDGYEKYMKNKYGDEWEKLKFIYK